MNKLLYVACCLVMLSQEACKKSPLTTYEASDNILFSYIEGADLATNTLGSYADSTDVAFAFSAGTVVDTIVRIPLAVTGLAKDHDRTYAVTAGPSSTAVANTDYEFPLPFTVRAGHIEDTLYVKLKRTALLKTTSRLLDLQLQETPDLKTQIKFRPKSPRSAQGQISPQDTVLTQEFKITFSDMLAAGPYWNDDYANYFGEFSEKKVRLMNAIAGLPLDFWSVESTTPEHLSSTIYYGGFMFRYLSDQAFVGNIIFEDDGTQMQMGSYYQ